MSNPNDQPPAPDQEPQTEKPMPFDEAVCDRLREAFHQIFLAHPEVKTLSATVCWHGNLNDARINHGVWLGEDGGPVRDIPGIIGSAYQTLKLLDEQCGQGMSFVNALREQVMVLSQEVVKANEELERLKRARVEEVQRHEAAQAAERTRREGAGGNA